MTNTPTSSDLALVKLAREIAMDIQPLEKILKQYEITDKTWLELQRNPRFKMLLNSEVEAWQTALNTHERVRMKSASMLEEWLPSLYQRINDMEENLPGVVEAGKLLGRLAGIGEKAEIGAAVGERFNITINMGDRTTEITKDVTPLELKANVVEGDNFAQAKHPLGDGK